MRILGSTAFGKEERQERDYYATDPVALEKFIEAFKADGNNISWMVWEPACGEVISLRYLLSNDMTYTNQIYTTTDKTMCSTS